MRACEHGARINVSPRTHICLVFAQAYRLSDRDKVILRCWDWRLDKRPHHPVAASSSSSSSSLPPPATPLSSTTYSDARSLSTSFVPLLSVNTSHTYSMAATPAPHRRDHSTPSLDVNATPGQTFVPFTPLYDTFTPLRHHNTTTGTPYRPHSSDTLHSIAPLSPLS